MYEDCLANPGRYFPADYAPIVSPLILDEADGFLPVAPEKITLAGDCPPYATKVTGFGVGSLSCLMTTPYTCEETDGECLCKKDHHIGSQVQTVCTES
jgi:hypothetical protein